jgi:hypothetical protein
MTARELNLILSVHKFSFPNYGINSLKFIELGKQPL